MNRFIRVMTAAAGVLAAAGGSTAEEPTTPKESGESKKLHLLVEPTVQIDPNALDQMTFKGDVLFVRTEPNSLGVEVAPVEKVLADQLNIVDGGLVVTAAPPEAPGTKAGLKIHDVLVKVDGAVVKDVKSLQMKVSVTGSNPVVLDLFRRGKPTKIEYRPMVRTEARFVDRLDEPDQYRIGVTLAPVDETLRSQLSLPEKVGLVVTKVLPDGPAAKAGVRQHDVVVTYCRLDVTSGEQLNGLLQEHKGAAADLKLLRQGKPVFLNVSPEKPAEKRLAIWTTTADRKYAFVTNRDHTNHSYITVRDAFQAVGNESPKAQIAAMKKQVAELTKSLAALEASLKPAPAAPSGK